MASSHYQMPLQIGRPEYSLISWFQLLTDSMLYCGPGNLLFPNTQLCLQEMLPMSLGEKFLYPEVSGTSNSWFFLPHGFLWLWEMAWYPETGCQY